MDTMGRESADDLAPEQLEEQATDLAAQAWSKRTGQPVDASSISLYLTRVVDEGDLELLEREEFRNRAAVLAELSVDEAVKLVAGLMPQLRPLLQASSRGGLDNEAVLAVAATDLVTFLAMVDLKSRLSVGREVPNNFGPVLERLAGYGLGRALILSAWLFPSIRPVIVANANGVDAQLFNDGEMLRQLAWQALDDDRWHAAEQQLIARRAESGRDADGAL